MCARGWALPRRKDCRRRNLPLGPGDADDLDIGRQRRIRADGRHHQTTHPIVGQKLGAGREPPSSIDHDPRRLWAGDSAYRELRIIGQSSPNPDHHGIHQSAKTMQMGKPRRPVDVVRMSTFRCNSAIQRLADLADRNQFIDPAMP